jgi:glycosyltransferase involved in cell wall biosynthesis
MNILYITRKFPPSIGGMQTQAYEFYNALRKREQVYLIAWGHSQKYLPVFLVKAALQAIYHCLKHNIDLVHMGDLALAPVGCLLKALFKKPLAVTVHGLDVTYPSKAYQFMLNRSLELVDKFLCVSHATKKLLIEKGVQEHRLEFLPNGINVGKWYNAENKERGKSFVKEKLTISLAGKKVLLTTGRIIRRKGVAFFVNCILPGIMANSKDVYYIIVGTGSEREAIEAVIKKHNLSDRVFMLDTLNDFMLRLVYAASDIFILPNQRIIGDFEGFGIVALEASMNELPVVAFAVDGIPDAVKDGDNGILVKEGDNKGFANAVEDLLRNDDKRAVLGKKAKEFVTKYYDWNVIISRYLCIIKNELSK